MFFMEHFVQFEEISKLDPCIDYQTARILEKLYVHRLEYQIRKQHNSINIHQYKEMSINLDYSKQTKTYKNNLLQGYGIIGVMEALKKV